MKIKVQAAFATLLVAVGALGLPAVSSAGINVDIDVAPPEPRVEGIPPPRVGYVWAPGYWAWRNGAHVWVGGHWVGERRGYHWVPDRWEQVGPHWHYWRGHWER